MVLPGLGWTFNTVAEEYDRWAPGYPPELYVDLFAYQPLKAGDRAAEVGIGTGQATRPVLDTGCAVIAVEPGDRLAAICRQKFEAYPGFAAVVSSFEEFEAEDGSFDLVYSAGAFHWVPEAVGYPKAFRLLRRGGTFARFARHPHYARGQEELYEAMQEVYRTYMPYSAPSPEYTEDAAKERAEVALKYGFADAQYHLYRRDLSYTAKEYVSLISTHSDHVILPEESRPGFYGGIRTAIERFGGVITVHETIDLQMARKI